MNRSVDHPAFNLIAPDVKATYFQEPCLLFGNERQHVHIKSGLNLFGPYSLNIQQRHPSKVDVGFVGDGRSIASAQSWIESCRSRIEGDSNNPAFPGFNEDYGFCSEIKVNDQFVETLTKHELSELKLIHKRKERFSYAINLISDKVRLLSQKDKCPDYIVLAIPDPVFMQCASVEYSDKEAGKVHRDLRKALKAELMKYRIPTQILLSRVSEAKPNDKYVDHKSKCAWNFFTGLYFKAGGIPWLPVGLTNDTCYVGISFFRPLGSYNSNRIHTSIAQAFDEKGEGIILRGQDFRWDEKEYGKAPHLNASQASDLINMVLKRYFDELKRTPRRIVIFKTSRFWPDEKSGFEDALKSVNSFDLVSIAPNNQIRLVRAGNYPPLRGTCFSVGEQHFLYTTGYIAHLKAYPHGHVPAPLQITDLYGDEKIETIIKEIMVLTKLNWNSASFACLMPITLTFSRLVGDIMKEIAPDREPLPQFKYYM